MDFGFRCGLGGLVEARGRFPEHLRRAIPRLSSQVYYAPTIPYAPTMRENGGDKLVHGSGGISQPRAE